MVVDDRAQNVEVVNVKHTAIRHAVDIGRETLPDGLEIMGRRAEG